MGALPLSAAPTSSLVPPSPALPDGLSLPSGRTAIMGTLNTTPDSFSDGGRYTGVVTALRYARAMVAAEADLIDVGGESTRPNSTRISADEEWARICTIIESLTIGGVTVSVDTLHVSTAHEAARVGTAVISDVSGGRWDPEINAAIVEPGCVYVVRHYRALLGMPGEHFDYGDDLMDTLIEHMGSQVHDTIDVDVTTGKIMVDPGLDFSLTGDQCQQILRELPHFLQGGYPIPIGASRKRFVGALDGDVDAGGTDIVAYRVAAGAWAVRIHNVAATATAITRKEADVD